MVSAEYYSYLLRLWQVPEGGSQSWRVLLENIQTGEKCGFNSLEDMVTFLRQVGEIDCKHGAGNSEAI